MRPRHRRRSNLTLSPSLSLSLVAPRAAHPLQRHNALANITAAAPSSRQGSRRAHLLPHRQSKPSRQRCRDNQPFPPPICHCVRASLRGSTAPVTTRKERQPQTLPLRRLSGSAPRLPFGRLPLRGTPSALNTFHAATAKERASRSRQSHSPRHSLHRLR